MKNKKAFTIVELVIVIAVIAILAAVLIPTFSNIIKKAQTSSDTQLIRNLNDALAIDLAEKEEDKHATCYDAMQAVEEAGYNVARIVAKSGYNIAWDLETGHFVLLNEQKNHVLYPVDVNTNEEYDITDEQDKANYFVVRYNVSGDDYVAPEHYSLYAGLTFNAKNITLNGVGFDAGQQKSIETVKYVNNSSTAKDVVIRTNTFGTKLIVDGYVDSSDKTKGDTIKHYGFAGLVEVKKVAMASYDEYAVVGRLFATALEATGHLDIKPGATVYQIEQLGGDATSVTVDENATVYDINHEKVEGAVAETNERFTEQAVIEVTDTHADGERITAQACVHEHTEDVVDGQHVYEVCKTCGYTLIKVDGVKKTVSTENVEEQKEENVIIPKAAYDGSQVTASSADNGEVQINIDSTTGDYVEPSISKTPEINAKNNDTSCKHEWANPISSEDGTHAIKCINCELSYKESCDFDDDHKCKRCNYFCTHCQFNEKTQRLYYNCPYCSVAFGTKDLPYSLTKPEHYQALLIYREFSSSGKFGIYREDDDGYLDWIYINLDANIDCSNVDTEGYYTYPEYMILNGKNHILSGLKGYCAFNKPYGQCYISDVTFKNCEFKYGMFYNVTTDDDLYLNCVTYDDCDCTYYGGLVAFKIAGDTYIDECNFKNIDFTGAYAYGITYGMTGKLEITGSNFTNINYYLNSYSKGLINSIQGPTTISDCVFDNIYGEHAIAYTVKNALTVSNCTIKNSNLQSAIAYGNWAQAYSGTIMNITNTHVQDSTLRGGGFVYYQAAECGNIAFTSCSITNSKVIGANSMACGGFIGNCGSSSTFTNCTVDAEIENGNVVAAFVGQSSVNTTLINCSVSKNTTLCNKASGTVYAYASQYLTITDCTFEGIALTGSVNSANGNSIVTFVEGTNFIKYPLGISASEFVIETDGTIKYTGSSSFGRMEIAAGIICDIYKNGQPSDQGGFLQGFCELEASNISGATTLGNLFVPSNLKVYVEKNDTYDDTDVCGNTIVDSSVLENGTAINLLFFKNNNVLYLKSVRSSSGISYIPSSFHNGSTPVVPESVWASVIVRVYDDSNNIKAIINLGYNITVSQE